MFVGASGVGWRAIGIGGEAIGIGGERLVLVGEIGIGGAIQWRGLESNWNWLERLELAGAIGIGGAIIGVGAWECDWN